MASEKHLKKKIKILIVDDHPVLRQGVAQMISREDDLTVCGDAADAPTALALAEREQPDLAIVDLTLKESSGIDLIKDLLARWPNIRVLVLSMHNESFYAERVLRAGARGYVTKGEASTKIIEAIRRVLAGQVYTTETLAAKMLQKMIGPHNDSGPPSVDRLSSREFEVFQLLGQGLQTREIADKLHVSVKTIDAHRENIKGKLCLHNATELIKTAIQWVQFERGG